MPRSDFNTLAQLSEGTLMEVWRANALVPVQVLFEPAHSTESTVSEAADESLAVGRAVAAGESTYNEPQDHGFMYQHGFQDPDGHIWELFFMDPNAIPQAA